MTSITTEAFDAIAGGWRSRVDGHTEGASTGLIPTYLGAANADFDNFNDDVSNPDGTKAGGVNTGLGLRRSYDNGSWPSSFSQSAAASDIGRGVGSYWSCYPSLTSVLNGSLDSTITAFFNSIPSGHTMFITTWHEPDVNNKFAPGQYADFRSGIAHQWDLLQASDADTSRVKFGPLLTQSGFRSNGGPDWFPSNGKYDFVGSDNYEFRRPDPNGPPDLAKLSTQNGGYGFSKTPAQLASDMYNFAASVGKPILVGELGIHPDPANLTDRGTRLQAWMDYFESCPPGCLGVCLFHSQAGESGPWWWDCFPNWKYPSCTHTNNSTTLTAPSGTFVSTDVGSKVSGTGIASNATIASRQSSSQVTMSTGATGSGTNKLTIVKPLDHDTFPDPTTLEAIRDIVSAHAVNPG